MQEYSELDRRLNTYAVNSSNAIPINPITKKRIWNNLYSELYMKRMAQMYSRRRFKRLAFALSLLLVLWIGIDMSSDASLFRRLLIDIGHNSITFYEKGTVVSNFYEDVDMKKDIEQISANNNTQYVTPMLLDSYEYIESRVSGEVLEIDLKHKEKELSMQIFQKDISIGEGSSIQYDNNIFDIRVVKRHGVEYIVLQNKHVNICKFILGDIEYMIKGDMSKDLLEQAYIIGNK